MPDRTLNYGDPADAATRYRTRDDDPAGGGNFVVVEDLDGNLIPLQYNPTSGALETAVPIDTGSNNITTTGTVSTETLEADDIDTNRTYQDVTSSRSLNTTETNNFDSEMEVVVVVSPDVNSTFVKINADGSSFPTGVGTAFTNDVDPDETVRTEFTVGVGEDYKVNAFGDLADYSLKFWGERR